MLHHLEKEMRARSKCPPSQLPHKHVARAASLVSFLPACSALLHAMQLDMYLLDTAAAALGPQAATAAYFGAWAGYSLVAGACSAIIGSVTYAQAAVYGPSYCQVGCPAARIYPCIYTRVVVLQAGMSHV